MPEYRRGCVDAAITDDPAALRALLAETHDIISVVEAEGSWRWVSPALHRVLGYREVPDGFPNGFVHREDMGRVRSAFQSLLAGAPSATVEYRVRHADGDWRWVEVTGRNRFDDPHIRGVVAITRDITSRKLAEEELAHAATHDPLTDLPNRALFDYRLDLELAGLRASAGRVVVLFLDVDGFKSVNDRLGHTAGDAVLRVLARRLLEAVRPGDTVARYGGDEFLVLATFPPEAPDRSVELLALRVQDAFCTPIDIGGVPVTLGASVGWHATSAAGTSPGEMVHRADVAAYEVKRTR